LKHNLGGFAPTPRIQTTLANEDHQGNYLAWRDVTAIKTNLFGGWDILLAS
jgi:hypothetical protein